MKFHHSFQSETARLMQKLSTTFGHSHMDVKTTTVILIFSNPITDPRQDTKLILQNQSLQIFLLVTVQIC